MLLTALALAAHIHHMNPEAPAELIAINVYKNAARFNIEPELVAAVIATESRFNNAAIGGLGEIGLMQLRPEYHRFDDLADLERNIYYGVKYLSWIKHKYGRYYGDSRYIEHYNCGPGKKPESFKYTQRVLEYKKVFSSPVKGASSGRAKKANRKLREPREGFGRIVRGRKQPPTHESGRAQYAYLPPDHE